MLSFHILTLFPEMITSALGNSIVGRAAERELISVNAVNIRDYTASKHKKVDDYPYGGGAGMLLQAQPIYDAYLAIKEQIGKDKVTPVIYLTPQAKLFTQEKAASLATHEDLILLSGHYEGVDERVLEEIVTDYISIGDYILTGGELPAMVLVDAITRLIPGALSNTSSIEGESFSESLLEYPQYTRPEIWREKKVPEILLSGNHKEIEKWRQMKAVERTRERRPELLDFPSCN